MTSRGWAWIGLLAGAVAAVAVAAQGWWTVRTADFSGTVTGTDSTSSLAMVLAVVVAAGLLLSLTLRHRGRQVLGVVLALIGIAMVVVAVDNPAPSQTLVDQTRSGHTLETQVSVTATAWPWAYALAGLIVLAASVLTVWKAPTWPRAADRYSRRAAGAGVTAADDPAEVWKAMDAGFDPTDGEASEPGPKPAGD